MQSRLDEIAVDWAGEQWMLLGSRAMYLSRKATLVIADPHLGKAAAFRAAGVPVPEVMDADLGLLASLIERHRVAHLLIVGDLIHASHGRTAAVIDGFARWRVSQASLQVTLVRGNHDARAGDPPREWGIEVVNGPWRGWDDVDVEFVHDPDREPSGRHHSIGGHLHPAVRLTGPVSSMRAACFWLRAGQDGTSDSLVLPAFGRFTGAAAVRPRAIDRVWTVRDGQVVEVGNRARAAATS